MLVVLSLPPLSLSLGGGTKMERRREKMSVMG